MKFIVYLPASSELGVIRLHEYHVFLGGLYMNEYPWGHLGLILGCVFAYLISNWLGAYPITIALVTTFFGVVGLWAASIVARLITNRQIINIISRMVEYKG